MEEMERALVEVLRVMELPEGVKLELMLWVYVVRKKGEDGYYIALCDPRGERLAWGVGATPDDAARDLAGRLDPKQLAELGAWLARQMARVRA